MSGLEIERKFLVHKWMDWKRLASSCSHIQQGYFAAVNTVRVRIRDDKGYLSRDHHAMAVCHVMNSRKKSPFKKPNSSCFCANRA